MGDPFRDGELAQAFGLTDLDLAYLRVADNEIRELALETEWTITEWGKLSRKAMNMAEIIADHDEVTVHHLSRCVLYLLNTIEEVVSY